MARSRHRHHTKKHSLRPLVSSRLRRGLDEASELLAQRKSEEAIKLLTGLREQYPDNYEVLHQLAAASHEAGDETGYLTHCRALVAMKPNDPYLRLILSTAYVKAGHLVKTYLTDREFVERWPDHSEAGRLRDQLVKLESNVFEMIGQAGLQGEEGLAIAAQHEELQYFLHAGLYEEGIRAASDLIERHPQYAPVHNNLSLIYFYNDQPDEAIASARHVLTFDPENLQATANLARMLFLKAQDNEARQLAERLKHLRGTLGDYWIKQAETFSFLSEDEAVLETYQKAQVAGMFDDENIDPTSKALLHHLAGAASMHLGDEPTARHHWKQALQLVPGFELARANLSDLNQPVGQRHGVYAYNLGYWIPHAWVDHLVVEIEAVKTSETAVQAVFNERLQKSFNLVRLAPLLLARSDEDAARMLIRLARFSKHPELLTALKDFAFGQRGSDALRNQAALALSEAGVINAGEVEMWVSGKLSPVVLLNTFIRMEPHESTLPPKAQRLGEKGFFALQQNDGVRAEQLLREALKIAPDTPNLKNNLAQALMMQGRKDDYRALMESVCADHPEYFFSIIYRAKSFIERQEYDRAQEIVNALMQRSELHVSEFAMMATLQIELAEKRNHLDIAKQWFQTMEQVYPDHPNVEILRRRLWPPKFEAPDFDMMNELQRLFRSRNR